MSIDDPTSEWVEATATCHTDGCDNAGIPIEVVVDPNASTRVVTCGSCGQQITDVVATTTVADSNIQGEETS